VLVGVLRQVSDLSVEGRQHVRDYLAGRLERAEWHASRRWQERPFSYLGRRRAHQALLALRDRGRL